MDILRHSDTHSVNGFPNMESPMLFSSFRGTGTTQFPDPITTMFFCFIFLNLSLIGGGGEGD